MRMRSEHLRHIEGKFQQELKRFRKKKYKNQIEMSETYAVSLPHADDGEFNGCIPQRHWCKERFHNYGANHGDSATRVDLGSAEVLREAGNFPWLAHVVTYFFGMETRGPECDPQRIRHICFVLMYFAMALIIWLSGVAGFSEGGHCMGLAIFLSFIIFMLLRTDYVGRCASHSTCRIAEKKT